MRATPLVEGRPILDSALWVWERGDGVLAYELDGGERPESARKITRIKGRMLKPGAASRTMDVSPRSDAPRSETLSRLMETVVRRAVEKAAREEGGPASRDGVSPPVRGDGWASLIRRLSP